ncbi:MAG: tRNA (adenosine(37)-N6)-threonylcarbamoyltransferase complex dimerization subunit type 1 TsaB [Tepidiformaceae bacterium]
MSTILAIDTASAEIALALCVEGEIVASPVFGGGHDHSRLLLPAIEQLLGRRRRELTGIAVVRGPGNYAGLRVGIATATGLAYALRIPIRGISTMEAVACAIGPSPVTVIHPAGRNEFAVQQFEEGVATGPLHALPAEQLHGAAPAGQGAAAFGGREVSPEARVRAALLALSSQFESPSELPPLDALYLREPNITLPRRPLSARAG